MEIQRIFNSLDEFVFWNKKQKMIQVEIIADQWVQI